VERRGTALPEMDDTRNAITNADSGNVALHAPDEAVGVILREVPAPVPHGVALVSRPGNVTLSFPSGQNVIDQLVQVGFFGRGIGTCKCGLGAVAQSPALAANRAIEGPRDIPFGAGRTSSLGVIHRGTIHRECGCAGPEPHLLQVKIVTGNNVLR